MTYGITITNIIRYIPYGCFVILGLILLAIIGSGYLIYNVSKNVIYSYSFYIPYSYTNEDRIYKIEKWINENMNGYYNIEDDIQASEGDWPYGYPSQNILTGWTLRFTHSTDAMAFKLVWMSKT